MWRSVGPGELLLVAWILAAVPPVAALRARTVAPAARPFLAFWAASLALLLAGWAAGAGLVRAAPDAGRDFLAYGLVACLVGVLALRPGGADETRRAARVALFAGTGALVFLLAWMVWSLEAGPLDLMLQGRFRGWSWNPNQVAVAMCVVPFLAARGLRRSRGAGARGAYAAALAGSVLVGVASGSDGLALAWVGATALLALHAWLLAVRGGAASSRRGMAVYVVAPLLAVAAVGADGRVPLRLAGAVERIYSEESSGPERLDLWMHALRNAAASPLVGLGPGSHSAPSVHTWGNRKGPMEAHNVVVDWGAATGVLGVLLLVGLFLSVARAAARAPLLMAALVALLVLGMAQYYLRHPLVWLYLLAIAELARADGRDGGGCPPLPS